MNHPEMVPESELDFDSDLIFTYKGELFTGISFEETETLGRSEVSYRNGMQEGCARDWYPSGALKSESHYIEGAPHGESKEFDSSGSLTEEAHFEYGIRVWARRYDSNGDLVAAEELDSNDWAYTLLERYRTEKRWPDKRD